mmetsp:Transcript_26559/g.76168  ORF Transcript_26559/g.76168 Transcript_26559/m.76168 type:complete len:264 (-) Transcript_26559:327-1118(-)
MSLSRVPNLSQVESCFIDTTSASSAAASSADVIRSAAPPAASDALEYDPAASAEASGAAAVAVAVALCVVASSSSAPSSFAFLTASSCLAFSSFSSFHRRTLAAAESLSSLKNSRRLLANSDTTENARPTPLAAPLVASLTPLSAGFSSVSFDTASLALSTCSLVLPSTSLVRLMATVAASETVSVASLTLVKISSLYWGSPLSSSFLLCSMMVGSFSMSRLTWSMTCLMKLVELCRSCSCLRCACGWVERDDQGRKPEGRGG